MLDRPNIRYQVGMGGGALAGAASPVVGGVAGAIGAGAIGLSALALPLGVVFGAISGILAYKSAKARNRAIEQAARINMQRLNDYVTDVRLERYRQMDRLAREGRAALGQVFNVAPYNTAVIMTLASRVAGGIARDQFAIDETLRGRERAVESEKQAIAAQANAGMVSPGLAAFQGGLGGFSAGMELGGAISSAFAQKGLSDLARQLGVSELSLAREAGRAASVQSDSARLYTDYLRSIGNEFGSRISNSDARRAFDSVFLGPSVRLR